jgi:hypothetical protein
MIDENLIQNLFSNCDIILGINSKFLIDLKKVFNDWNAQTGKIAPVFIEFGNFFKLYKDYCNNTDLSQKTLKELMESKKYRDF